MTVFPGEIPKDVNTLHQESYGKTASNEIGQRVILESAGGVDPTVVQKFHTSPEGEITEVTETTTYLQDGSVDTVIYTVGGVNFRPTGIISSLRVKTSLGSQVIQVTDTALIRLRAPANTNSAYIQNHTGVSIKFSTSGVDPVKGLLGVGYVLDEGVQAELESLDECNKFRAIAVDNSAAGEIYVEYFNL